MFFKLKPLSMYLLFVILSWGWETENTVLLLGSWRDETCCLQMINVSKQLMGMFFGSFSYCCISQKAVLCKQWHGFHSLKFLFLSSSMPLEKWLIIRRGTRCGVKSWEKKKAGELEQNGWGLGGAGQEKHRTVWSTLASEWCIIHVRKVFFSGYHLICFSGFRRCEKLLICFYLPKVLKSHYWGKFLL